MIRGIEMNLRAAYARAWIKIKGSNTEPQWMVAGVTIPLLAVSAFVMIYRTVGAPPEFAAFVIIGGSIVAIWSNIVWHTAFQLYWEKEVGNLELYMVAPISRVALLLGLAIGSVINSSLRAAFIFIAGYYLFGVSVVVGDLTALVLIFILALISLYALGMVFASIFLVYGRGALQVSDLLQEPVHFLSGFYFPVFGNRFLPLALVAVASILPLTYGLEGIRQVLIFGASLQQVLPIIAILLIFSLILIPLSVLLLRRIENYSKRVGRLTLRWQ